MSLRGKNEHWIFHSNVSVVIIMCFFSYYYCFFLIRCKNKQTTKTTKSIYTVRNMAGKFGFISDAVLEIVLDLYISSYFVLYSVLVSFHKALE